MNRRSIGLGLAALILLAPTARADVAGPIRVSPDGRQFVDNGGKPFFWLGDTAWPLFTEYPQAAAEAYLKNRAAKGFTVIQGVLAWAHGGTGFEKSKSPIANVFGDKPWTNDDPSTPNDAFFKHVDHLVDIARKQGLVLAILPAWGYYVNNVQVLNAKNARTYGRWLAARYKAAPNIIWVLGGDRVATGFEAVWRELATGLREGEGRARVHLITYHPCGRPCSSAQHFHREPWLDFNMIETWTDWPKVYPAVLTDTLLPPRKPVVLAEGAYENGPEYPLGPITPLLVRRQAWWTTMAGGFHTYGQDQMWRLEEGWEKTFDTPGAGQVAKMKEILSARDWWNLIPDQGLFATGTGSERTLNTAMRSMTDEWALVYLASQCTVFLHLHRFPGKSVRATWINPITAERKPAGEYPTGNGGGATGRPLQSFTTPSHWEDALLLLENH